MAHDVFISYSSKDKPTADAVCASLEKNHIRCWIAPRDVLSGMLYSDAIINAINGSKVMILVFSQHSNTSTHVIRELERAVNKGIPIIPFRIENVPLSSSMEYFIALPHWLDALTPPLERHLEKLVATVQGLLAVATSSESRPREVPSPLSAVDQLRRAAESGDADSMVALGNAYVNGDGVPQDFTQSSKWFRKAAELGDCVGQNNIGFAYYRGDGVEQNYQEAMYWFQVAIDQDYGLACGNLALMYFNGEGVLRDYKEAKRLWEMGAERGDPTSMYNLGMMLENGHGCVRDFFTGVSWYQKAAKMQQPDALERLRALKIDIDTRF